MLNVERRHALNVKQNSDSDSDERPCFSMGVTSRNRSVAASWLFSCRSFQVSVSHFAKVHLNGRLLNFTPPLQKLSARQLSCVL
jgi:hypothetical protein